MIIDTHIHIWDLEQRQYSWLEGNTSILNRTYLLDELEEARKEVGITGGILVQAANHFEDMDAMLSTAATTDWIKGVVGWMPLMDPLQTAQYLEKYRSNSYFKGVRHLIHDEPDARWLLQPSVIESLKILAAHQIPYDLVGILPAHLSTLLEVLEQVPDLSVMIDHLNQPPILQQEKFGEWGDLMKAIANHPRVFAKISGLGTASGDFENWTVESLKPYIHFVLEHFGVGRCVCGGDWPVSLLAGSYVKIWDAYKEILGTYLSERDQERVFYQNAVNFYQL